MGSLEAMFDLMRKGPTKTLIQSRVSTLLFKAINLLFWSLTVELGQIQLPGLHIEKIVWPSLPRPSTGTAVNALIGYKYCALK